MDFSNSLFLKNEIVTSLLKCSPTQILASTFHNQLLLLENWVVIRKFEDPSELNNRSLQGWLCKLPGFNMEKFPFIVWSGETSINLVNINEGFTEPLIYRDYASFDHRGQQGVFCKGKLYGMTLHFSAKQIFKNGDVRLNWCKMSFKPDFKKMLDIKSDFSKKKNFPQSISCTKN